MFFSGFTEGDLQRLIRRFKSHVRIDETTGCWIWTGAHFKNSGWARAFINRHEPMVGHRLSWAMFKRQYAPAKAWVVQMCKVRDCVNPDHLALHWPKRGQPPKDLLNLTTEEKRYWIGKFLSYVHRETNGCWLWTGAWQLRGGACGRFFFGGSMRLVAHRASWLLFRGPIPQGFYVKQTCGAVMCVRPKHLYVATLTANLGLFAVSRANGGHGMEYKCTPAPPLPIPRRGAQIMPKREKPAKWPMIQAMLKAGKKTGEIRRTVRCGSATVAYHRKKLRTQSQELQRAIERAAQGNERIASMLAATPAGRGAAI